MTRPSGFFGPSERALQFGEQYAAVLARWADLFAAAGRLVEANVALGRMTNEASKEFEQWLQTSANAPWSWLKPESMQQFLRTLQGTPPPPKP